MARLDVTRVEGFEELNRKLKKLADSAKRTEVISILRRLARPVVATYRSKLPNDEGVLQRSVGVRAVPKRFTGGNPAISVRPGKRGRNDAYYMFMIIPRGSSPGSTRRGSRKRLNTVVTTARDKTIRAMEGGLVENAEKETAKYIQKKIYKLSTV